MRKVPPLFRRLVGGGYQENCQGYCPGQNDGGRVEAKAKTAAAAEKDLRILESSRHRTGKSQESSLRRGL